MKVHFSISWSKTSLYNAGKRDLIINWMKGEGFPREGEAINIPKFIGKNYEPHELFKQNNIELNVFDWVEIHLGWEIKKLIWDQREGTTFLRILVSDRE